MAQLIRKSFTSKTSCYKLPMSTMDKTKMKTAGIIVIGDEILKGEVVDTNSNFMTTRLHTLGVKVKKISVIGDLVDEISKEVRNFSDNFSYVITTGGIGPTHDDVTFEAVAKAFGESLIMHPELVKLCFKFYDTTNPQSPGMKLAQVPQSSVLTFAEDRVNNRKMDYPNVNVKNVYMFPGIPELFEKSFDNLCDVLFKSASKFYSKCIYCKVTEDKLVEVLDYMVKKFPDVEFGSYPKLNKR